MILIAIVCLYFLNLNSINGANILGIYYHAGKSHHILGETLLKQLAKRGHNVTMVSPFPLSEPFSNYTDIHLTGIVEDQLARERMFMKMNEGHALIGTNDVLALTRAQMELTLNHEEITKLLLCSTKFDVIIVDWFLNPAIMIFGKLFNAPIIAVASHGALANYYTGNPAPPSYLPRAVLPFTNNMTFFQRVVNGICYVFLEATADSNFKYHQGLVDKYFRNLPPLEELVKNYLALVLSNGHYSFESPRPLVPSIIQVGGFHVQKPKQLPEDLQNFMDSAENGVIYFSLGSNMKSVLLPEDKQIEILRAFSKIPYRVLWKWERDDLPDIPENVLISEWFPQSDILGHPKLKLFISHGGLLSTIESLHYGIPIVGIPIFGDQKANIPKLVEAGYALQLDLSELNERSFLKVLNEILNNPRYAETAKRRSRLLHDQPLPPMETAVFWVEHVIRNKGAPHLRNAGIDLRWYEYLMLDVAAFVLAGLFGVIFVLGYVVKTIFRLVRNEKSKLD